MLAEAANPAALGTHRTDIDLDRLLQWRVMNPATDLETRAAVERFARLPADERDAIMSRGRRIETVEDLEGLSEAQVARLRPIIEEQTPKP